MLAATSQQLSGASAFRCPSLRRCRHTGPAPTAIVTARRNRLLAGCTCSLGGPLGRAFGSGDGEDFDYSLSRELESRTSKYKSLASHLDLLYKASGATSSSIELCQCCRGSGEQECNFCHGTGAMTVGDMLYCSEGGCAPCPVCRGKGQCKCPNCCGTGKRASWLAQGPPS